VTRGDGPATKPACGDCGQTLTCGGCDDQRPTADQLYAGWMLRTPLGRWEQVVKVDDKLGYLGGPIFVYTEKSAGHGWKYNPRHHVDAERPRFPLHGDPQVRVVELAGRDNAMYAVACLSTDQRNDPTYAGVIAWASTPGRGEGWTVEPRFGDGPHKVVRCDSKREARTELRALARRYARALGAKFHIEQAGQ
jgi:hypothetical protein